MDRDDDTELVYVIKFLKEFLSRRDESCAALQLLEEEGYDLCAPICEGSRVTTLRDICVNVAWDDSRILPKLKEMNVDLDEAFADGCTPANIIAGKGIPNRLDDNDIHERIAGLFDYFSKASMERLNNEGKAAIHLAAEKNSYLVLKKMIERGVNPELTTDAPCQAGNTPLHIACMRNNIESVQELLEAGADDSLVNQDEETPAHCLFSDYRSFNSEKSRNIMAMLNSIDTPKAGTGETPFILMLKKDPVYVKEFTALMLEKGVDVNRADNRGNTPLLIHARKHCDRDVVKLMLNAGADINARDEEGNSVLHYVLKNGNCELARLLIKKGADYNVANHEGQTPVNIAVEKGYDVVLELMTDI